MSAIAKPKILTRLRYGQDHLDVLCHDRPLRTPEIHKHNAFYGQAWWMKRYAGWPENRPLRGMLEHGIIYIDDIHKFDREGKLPLFFAASQTRAEVLTRETGKPSWMLGFGFLYAIAAYHRYHGGRLDADDSERQGTIVFPSHSSEVTKAEFDYADYAARLKALPEKCHPVVVSIYWRDFHAGAHLPYIEAGLPVVTCGHMYDPWFFGRLYDLCRCFRYATSNNIGAHLHLASATGCRFFYTDSREIRHQGLSDGEILLLKRHKEIASERALTRHLFGDIRDEVTPEQAAYVDKYIGHGWKLSPRRLRVVFRRAELFDRWAINPKANQPGSSRWFSSLPYALQRSEAVLKLLRRLARG